MIIWGEHMTVKQLRAASKHRDLVGTSKMRKPELLNALQLHDAATVLQRKARAWYYGRTPVNDTDPISFEPLPVNPFRFVSSSGQTIGYDANTLAQYALASGPDFKDPVTRELYTDTDLQRLERASGVAGVLDAVRSIVEDEAQIVVLTELIGSARELLADLERTIQRYTQLDGTPDVYDPESLAHYMILQFVPAMNLMCDLMATHEPPNYEQFATDMLAWLETNQGILGRLPSMDHQLVVSVIRCLAVERDVE